MGPYKHEIVNLTLVKVIGSGTDILQSNHLVLLIPHILPSLIINNKNSQKPLFFERILKISDWPYKHETTVP